MLAGGPLEEFSLLPEAFAEATPLEFPGFYAESAAIAGGPAFGGAVSIPFVSGHPKSPKISFCIPAEYSSLVRLP